MSKTREQLVNEALKNMQAVGSGQEPADEDYDEVDDKVESLLAQLRVDEVCDVENVAEIPDELFDALAELLAISCSTKFGLTYDPQKKLYFEGLLKRTVAARPTYEPLRVDYF